MAKQFQISDEFNLFVDSDSITIEFDGDSDRPVSLAGVTLDRTQSRALIDWLTERFGLPWISVEDRLPEDHEVVEYVWIGDDYFSKASYEGGRWFDVAGDPIHGVTHYLPRCKMEGPR